MSRAPVILLYNSAFSEIQIYPKVMVAELEVGQEATLAFGVHLSAILSVAGH